MRAHILTSMLAVSLAITVPPAMAETSQQQYLRAVNSLPWQSYGTGHIASVAHITLNGNLRFLDPVSTSRLLQLNGNPPRSNEYALSTTSNSWFAVFSFRPDGYIRDNDTLNQDQLLDTLQKINEAGAEERRQLNLPILHLVGWAVPPHYDFQTRRLEWGTRLVDDSGDETVNYTVRLLGRGGYISAMLVSSPQFLSADLQEFRSALRGFDYDAGQRYTEFRQGDRVAEYGLAALIVGGAAAAAAKGGLFKVLGKFAAVGIFGAFAAVVAVFKKLFRRKAPSA